MDVTRYDDVLLGVLQHCEQIEPFLEAMFSFLARRTDFFRLMHSRDDKMGFPPGVAEKMVIKVCIYTIAIVGTASLFCTWFGIPWFKNRTSSLLDASKVNIKDLTMNLNTHRSSSFYHHSFFQVFRNSIATCSKFGKSYVKYSFNTGDLSSLDVVMNNHRTSAVLGTLVPEVFFCWEETRQERERSDKRKSKPLVAGDANLTIMLR